MLRSAANITLSLICQTTSWCSSRRKDTLFARISNWTKFQRDSPTLSSFATRTELFLRTKRWRIALQPVSTSVQTTTSAQNNHTSQQRTSNSFRKTKLFFYVRRTLAVWLYRVSRLTHLLTGLKHYQGIGAKEQYEIFKLVTQELGQKPIVVDGGDLVQDPGHYVTSHESCHVTINVGGF